MTVFAETYDEAIREESFLTTSLIHTYMILNTVHKIEAQIRKPSSKSLNYLPKGTW